MAFHHAFFSFLLLPLLPASLLHATEVPQERSNRLPFDTGFETGAGDLFTRDIAGAARAQIDGQEAAEGEQSLKLAFGEGDRTQGEPVVVKAGEQTFSFYAKADAPTKVQVRFVKTDWSHTMPSPDFEVGTEWKRFTVTRTFKEGFYSMHFGREGEGTLWLDGLQLEAGKVASEYKASRALSLGIEIPSEANRVFFRKEPVDVTVALHHDTPAEPNAQLKIEVRDSYGNIVASEMLKKVEWNKQGSLRKRMSLNPQRLGLYEVKATYSSDSYSAEETGTFAVVASPVALQQGLVPFVGINPPASNGTRRLGAHWVGMAVQWSIIEAKEGAYVWTGYDHFFRNIEPGERVILSIGRNPAWAWDPKEVEKAEELGIRPGPWGFLIDREKMDAWRRFIRTLVERYRDRVDVWEIGAEDDLHWGQHPFYAKLNLLGVAPMSQVYERQAETIVAAADEIRKLVPEAKIGAIRPSGVDAVEVTPMYRYSSAVLEKAGKAINVFPIDPYGSSRYLVSGQTGIREPEAYLPDSYRAVREMLDKVSPESTFYVSEFGYSVGNREGPNGAILNKVAQYLARTFLLSRATPGLWMTRWYTGFGGGSSVSTAHYNMWHGRNPSLSVPAFSAVAAVVENTLESQRADLGKKVWAVVFRKEDHARGAIWQAHGTSRYRFTHLDGMSFTDMMGNPLVPENTDEGIELEVGQSPLYLSVSGEKASEQIVRFFESGQTTSAPLELALVAPRVNGGLLYLHNLSAQEMKIGLKATSSKGGEPFEKSVNVAKGQRLGVEVPLGEGSEELLVECDFGGVYKPVQERFPLEFHASHRVVDEFPINGDLSKWKQAPVAILDNEKHLRPEDWNPWKGKEDLSVEFFTGWNEHYLYLAARVRDDMQTDAASLVEIGKGDCMEVGIVPLVEGAGDGGEKAPAYFDFHIARDRDGNMLFKQWIGPGAELMSEGDYVVVRNDDEKTTVYEMRIAWDRLGVKPEEGRVFGVNTAVFDDDAGQKSRAWMQWGLGLTQGKTPSLFPKIYLKR